MQMREERVPREKSLGGWEGSVSWVRGEGVPQTGAGTVPADTGAGRARRHRLVRERGVLSQSFLFSVGGETGPSGRRQEAFLVFGGEACFPRGKITRVGD